MNNNEEDRVFESLLEYLRESRGFDFTGYKRSTLKRRVIKQMQSCNIDNLSEYLDYLQVHTEEFLALFNTILINVTAFFRDKPVWNYFQQQILPRILAERSLEEKIRIWSAGCASGEEAYTLAMIFAEELGLEQFRQRVKIYATDVDEEALNQARQASYSAKAVKAIPAELTEKYFEVMGGKYIFRPDLRRTVIFGRHDLVQDAPISRLDLLVCRNTLMYFNAETQTKILNRFHFALDNSGFLFLGKAEMLLTHSKLFTPVSLPHRIFKPVPLLNRRNSSQRRYPTTERDISNNFEYYLHLQEAAFDIVSTPQLIVDYNGNLILANLAARKMFNIDPLVLGNPLQDLEISYRPLELRSKIEQVQSERRLVVVRNVVRHLSIEVDAETRGHGVY